MNHTILFVLLAIIFLNSCGYSPTEEDKYPDMAEFPYVDGDGITLERDYVDFTKIYVVDKDLIGISFRGKNILAIRMDQNFNKIDSVKISEYYHISPDGFIYFKNEIGGFSKVHYLTHELKEVPRHPFDFQKVYVQKLDSISTSHSPAKKLPNDSLTLNKDQQIDLAQVLTYKLFEVEVLARLLSQKFIDNDAYLTNQYIMSAGHILKYSTKEYFIEFDKAACIWIGEPSYHHRYTISQALNDSISVWKSPNKLIIDPSENNNILKVFDSAIMENRSSGNHYTFSFHPIGYDYIKLNYKQKEVKFKTYDTYLRTFYSSDSSVLVVTGRDNTSNDRDKGYYRIKLN